MQSQKIETELAYKSAKCNTLRQFGVITDPRIIYTLSMASCYIAHKAIIVRTSKIS